MLVTTNGLTTTTALENSEVSPVAWLVAVAVTVEPSGTVAVVGKERLTVVAAGERTIWLPKRVWPWLVAGLLKKYSTR